MIYDERQAAKFLLAVRKFKEQECRKRLQTRLAMQRAKRILRKLRECYTARGQD